MLNLKENLLVDTFVFRKFAWQSPDFFATISHRDLMKKSWIKLYTSSSLSCFMKCSTNKFILPILVNDCVFFLYPTLKDNCDEMNNRVKQHELPWICRPMFILDTKSFFRYTDLWNQNFPSVAVVFFASKLVFLCRF